MVHNLQSRSCETQRNSRKSNCTCPAAFSRLHFSLVDSLLDSSRGRWKWKCEKQQIARDIGHVTNANRTKRNAKQESSCAAAGATWKTSLHQLQELHTSHSNDKLQLHKPPQTAQAAAGSTTPTGNESELVRAELHWAIGISDIGTCLFAISSALIRSFFAHHLNFAP